MKYSLSPRKIPRAEPEGFSKSYYIFFLGRDREYPEERCLCLGSDGVLYRLQDGLHQQGGGDAHHGQTNLQKVVTL